MNIWVPVVAALGASLLTGIFAWGVSFWQELRRDRATDMREKSTAYHQLITYSLTFGGRIVALRNIMESASGLKGDTNDPFHLRRPFDQVDIYSWLEKDYIPINDAWSKIQIVGSSEAVDGATLLLDACAELLHVATTPGEAQQPAIGVASKQVIDAREAFIAITRKELGKEATAAPKHTQQDAAIETIGERGQETE